MSELVISGESQLDGDTDTLDRHDGHTSDGAADGNVDEGVLASITRAYPVDHDCRKDNDQQDVEEEAWLDCVVEDFVNRLHFLVWWSVQYDDHGTDQTDGASHLAQRAQVFAQEI